MCLRCRSISLFVLTKDKALAQDGLQNLNQSTLVTRSLKATNLTFIRKGSQRRAPHSRLSCSDSASFIWCICQQWLLPPAGHEELSSKGAPGPWSQVWLGSPGFCGPFLTPEVHISGKAQTRNPACLKAKWPLEVYSTYPALAGERLKVFLGKAVGFRPFHSVCWSAVTGHSFQSAWMWTSQMWTSGLHKPWIRVCATSGSLVRSSQPFLGHPTKVSEKNVQLWMEFLEHKL